MKRVFCFNLQSTSLEIPITPTRLPLSFFFSSNRSKAGWLILHRQLHPRRPPLQFYAVMSLWDPLAYNPHTNTHPLKFIHIVERLGDTESGRWKDLVVGLAADHSTQRQSTALPTAPKCFPFVKWRGKDLSQKERNERRKYICILKKMPHSSEFKEW